MKELYTIGKMSKLFNLTIVSLRHYADIGLFKPYYIDPSTNYRYYHVSQFDQLNTLVHLRSLGLSLDEIKIMLSDANSVDYHNRLKDHLLAIRQKINQLQQVEKQLKQLEDHMAYAQTGKLNCVDYKAFPSRTLVELVRDQEDHQDLHHALKDLEAKAGQVGLIYHGKYGLGITHQHLRDRNYSQDRIFLFVDLPDLRLPGWVTVDPGLYACYRFYGDHDQAHHHYDHILQTLDQAGYTFIEDAYEVVLGLKGKDKLMEIQIPIAVK